VAVYRRSRRHRFVLLVLLLTSVTVITLDFRSRGSGVLESIRDGAGDVVAPVQSAVEGVLAPVGDFFGGITRYGKLRAENTRLRRQLDQARSDTLQNEGAERERQRLLELQDLAFARDIPSVAARVVATSPSNFQLTVTLDRGADANVTPGMPVVTGAGLVGRVIDVSRVRSTVLLISDPSSNVGVRLQGSGDVGVAKGAGSQHSLPVDLVAVETKVAEGEAVVTSGLQQSIYPPEVPVGRVRSVSTPQGALQQRITVDPVVDLRRLQFVKILLWRPPQ
jgi:rod shape-determining protein MreC